MRLGVDDKVIQVQGHGEVDAVPDIAALNLGVVSRESEARAAMQAASEKMHGIITAVREQGIAEHDIQTTQLNLFLDQQANVYVANHQVTVHAHDVSKAGAILDIAVEAGANANAGIQFALTDSSEWEDRALELAVADARRKAEKVAQALGIAIGRVDGVSVSGRGIMQGMPAIGRRAPGGSAAPSARIEVGQIRVTADVQVTYRFE